MEFLSAFFSKTNDVLDSATGKLLGFRILMVKRNRNPHLVESHGPIYLWRLNCYWCEWCDMPIAVIELKNRNKAMFEPSGSQAGYVLHLFFNVSHDCTINVV